MPTRWLVGMMGSGKSTIGQRAAHRLGLPFADTDEVLAAEGVLPDLLTSDPGAFRAAEEAVVAALAGSDGVVACGGGVILAAGNRERLRDSGPVVWLQAPPEVLATRVGEGDGRPLLAGDAVAALRRILGEREAWYAETANATVDAVGDIDEVTERVIAAWASWS